MKFITSRGLSTALRLFVCSGLLIGSSATSSYSFSQFDEDPLQSLHQLNNSEQYKLIAQSADPNQDRRLPSGTDLPIPLPTDAEGAPIDSPIPTESVPSPTDDQAEIFVERIEVVGNTVLDDEDIANIIQSFSEKTFTVADLIQAANDITNLYLVRGYITSRAVLPEQSITDGVVKIQVSEGSLSDIQVEGLSRLRAGYVTSRLQRGVTTPVNSNRLEEQLRLLSLDPLLENIRGRLQPGEAAGESVLNVTVEEADAWRFGASVDNYSNPSLGSERLGVSLAYQNLSGWGDQLSTSYHRSTTGGSNVWDLDYRLPVNAADGALSLQASFSDFEVTQGEGRGLFEGDSQRYDISFRQPLVRNLREEFALSAGFSYRDGQSFFGDSSQSFGVGSTTVRRTSVLKFGQDYTRRDTKGAWAVRSQFSLGTGLFDATNNEGDAGDGQFFSWLGQVQRVQRLSPDNLLIVKGDVQLTPDSLLASEQFVLGGGQSLRGYRQNARLGDNGFRLSVEDRIVLTRDEENGSPVIQLAPFFDTGAVWNASDAPETQNDQNFLAGAGLGFIYNPLESLNMRLDYAIPLVTLEDEGDNAQDEGFYFSVNYQY